MAKTWFDSRPMDSFVRAGSLRNVRAAGDIVLEEIKSSIAIQGYPEARRSLPGEPPRKEEGDLYESWTLMVESATVSCTCVVFSNDGKAYVLEVGAPAVELKPRPYIRRALLVREADIAAALTRPF